MLSVKYQNFWNDPEFRKKHYFPLRSKFVEFAIAFIHYYFAIIKVNYVIGYLAILECNTSLSILPLPAPKIQKGTPPYQEIRTV